MSNLRIVYNGLPFKPSLNGLKINWVNLMEFMKYRRGDYLEIDGWRFDLNYGLLYLIERKYWNYYIPPSGLRGKRVLDIGGGDGETAKYFIDNGASYVRVIESNEKCEDYLIYNAFIAHDKLTYYLKEFKIDSRIADHINSYYNLLKLDIEGYEIELLPYLDYLNDVDIILESHNNYITDKFLEKGFKLIKDFSKNKEIHGGVVQLCRWKK